MKSNFVSIKWDRFLTEAKIQNVDPLEVDDMEDLDVETTPLQGSSVLRNPPGDNIPVDPGDPEETSRGLSYDDALRQIGGDDDAPDIDEDPPESEIPSMTVTGEQDPASDLEYSREAADLRGPVRDEMPALMHDARWMHRRKARRSDDAATGNQVSTRISTR